MLSINRDGFGEFDHTHMIWLWTLSICDYDEVVFHVDLDVLSQLDVQVLLRAMGQMQAYTTLLWKLSIFSLATFLRSMSCEVLVQAFSW